MNDSNKWQLDSLDYKIKLKQSTLTQYIDTSNIIKQQVYICLFESFTFGSKPPPEERSFEDALIYMVNIFAGRDPPWFSSGAISNFWEIWQQWCCKAMFSLTN